MLVSPVPTHVKISIDPTLCFVGDNLHFICWTRHSGSPPQHSPHDHSVKFKSCETRGFCERVESGLGGQRRHLPGHRKWAYGRAGPSLQRKERTLQGWHHMSFQRRWFFSQSVTGSLRGTSVDSELFSGPLWGWMCGKDSMTLLFGLPR